VRSKFKISDYGLQIEIVEFKIETPKSMNQQEMKERTKEYAKRILKLCRVLPQTKEGQLFATQLFRAGTSV
jgi:hypothetical protein